MNKNYLKLFITLAIFLPVLVLAIGNLIALSEVTSFILWMAILISLILVGVGAFEPSNTQEITKESEVPRFIHRIKWIVILSTLILILPWNGVKSVYNQSVSLHYQYEQKSQEKPGFYDKMWKTYEQKTQLLNMNKETFIEVAHIVMDARKDGEHVAWKWANENQPVPFEQFSKFYENLSQYIENQRNGYFEIEKQCQQIAMENNILLTKFPNNLYNIFLGQPIINYKYGLLSDITYDVFNSGIENLK